MFLSRLHNRQVWSPGIQVEQNLMMKDELIVGEC